MKRMRKLGLLLALVLAVPVATQAQALEITKIIQEGVKKVIKAVDLQIQRLQNETIWLQNAQKTLENAMSKLHLDEISDWVERNRSQYAVYFDELSKVKSAISTYKKVRNIMEMQVRIVAEYKKAFALFRQDSHFSPDEIAFMLKVYTGILDESLKNLEQLFLVINAFKTEMTDGKRVDIINAAGAAMEENLNDLRQFNRENIKLSMQRSADERELLLVKALYGIQ